MFSPCSRIADTPESGHILHISLLTNKPANRRNDLTTARTTKQIKDRRDVAVLASTNISKDNAAFILRADFRDHMFLLHVRTNIPEYTVSLSRNTKSSPPCWTHSVASEITRMPSEYARAAIVV
jgi:hypothetical protein